MMEQAPLLDPVEMQPPKKNKKPGILIIGIVLVIILVVALLFLLNKKEETPTVTTTTTTTTERITKKTEESTTTTTETTKVIIPECEEEFYIPELIAVGKNDILRVADELFKTTYSNMNLYEMLYLNKTNFSKLPNQLKLQLLVNIFEHDCYPLTETNGAIMKYKMNKVFGNNFKITLGNIVDLYFNKTDKNFECKDKKSCTYLYTYNSGSDLFNKGLSNYKMYKNVGKAAYSKLVSYKEENGKYIITYKQVFIIDDKSGGLVDKSIEHPNGLHYHLYFKNIKGEELHQEPIYANNDTYGDGSKYVVPDKIYNKIKNKIPNTTYTFEVQGSNLVLIDIKY